MAKTKPILNVVFVGHVDHGKSTTIGIPRALMVFYQQFPFWRTFFEDLGFTVVISKESDKTLLTRSIETITTETCLPVEMIHGHVIDLLEKGVDYIFHLAAMISVPESMFKPIECVAPAATEMKLCPP